MGWGKKGLMEGRSGMEWSVNKKVNRINLDLEFEIEFRMFLSCSQVEKGFYSCLSFRVIGFLEFQVLVIWLVKALDNPSHLVSI